MLRPTMPSTSPHPAPSACQRNHPSVRLRTAAGCLVLALGLAGARAQTSRPTAASRPVETTSQPTSSHVDGVTISTHGSGRDWGTDIIGPTIAEIGSLGAGWVATHPYAWIRNDGQVAFRDFDPADPPAWLTRPITEAHARGMKILIKPHLGYWGSEFSWRGEIEFADATERARFWRTYTNWIVKVATACRDADGFAVGTELDKLLDLPNDGAEWRKVIKAIRAVTESPLTYAANWTDYQRVPFWDALDVIGIQAYFPLTTAPTADEAELRAAWRRRMQELAAFGEKHDRYIVFTELGYNRSLSAAVKPWDAQMDGEEALATQATCLRVALEAIRHEPRVVGSFLWKWFPGDPSRVHDFQIQTEALRDLIRSVWKKTP